MSWFIICYPKLSIDDTDWIQSIRLKHDSQFNIVRPHFTLVFGTNALGGREIFSHAQEAIKNQRRFNFALDQLEVVPDVSGRFSHLFLVPTKGYEEMTSLHDLLYTGPLGADLREDIPYIPHIGIANGSHEDMLQLFNVLQDERRRILGTIDEVSVVFFDGTNPVVDSYHLELS